MGVVKGTIKPGHTPRNSYKLTIVPPLSAEITAVSIGGLEQDTDTVTMPDRTVRTGGAAGIVEFDIGLPEHHVAEVKAMEAWRRETILGGPFHKKAVTIEKKAVDGTTVITWSLLGVLNAGVGTPDLEMENEGEMSVITYKLKADTLIVL